jgi:hypothetical protein
VGLLGVLLCGSTTGVAVWFYYGCCCVVLLGVLLCGVGCQGYCCQSSSHMLCGMSESIDSVGTNCVGGAAMLDMPTCTPGFFCCAWACESVGLLHVYVPMPVMMIQPRGVRRAYRCLTPSQSIHEWASNLQRHQLQLLILPLTCEPQHYSP